MCAWVACGELLMHAADFGPQPNHIVVNQWAPLVNETVKQAGVILPTEKRKKKELGVIVSQQILEIGIKERIKTVQPPPVVIQVNTLKFENELGGRRRKRAGLYSARALVTFFWGHAAGGQIFEKLGFHHLRPQAPPLALAAACSVSWRSWRSNPREFRGPATASGSVFFLSFFL